MNGPSTRFLDTEMPDLPPEKARFHVLPVPYEKTVSYGQGTALGARRDHRFVGTARALRRHERPGRRRHLHLARRGLLGSGCSAETHTGSLVSAWVWVSSCHHRSR